MSLNVSVKLTTKFMHKLKHLKYNFNKAY
ncbi:hypothetical protein F383_37122 [Gossypium arboreum]|uniref:Uncharacterized protein n=1 Tax=Gossypium arboreum TaxID=29729 RepID=A0A0B0ME96_GOSAR|nr:hypothetical protein F383_37122 [Gossypium arboreum]